GWRAQAHAHHVAAQVAAADQLAGKFPDRQLAWRQHAVPVQLAVAHGYSQAGEDLAMLNQLFALADLAAHQQGGADLAVAVPAAVRAVQAQAPGSVEDAFAGGDLQLQAGGLQGYFRHSLAPDVNRCPVATRAHRRGPPPRGRVRWSGPIRGWSRPATCGWRPGPSWNPGRRPARRSPDSRWACCRSARCRASGPFAW